MSLFFGYGANRNRGKLAQVLGHDPGEELGGIVEGYKLCYQNFELIPEKVAEIIGDVYGHEYKTYTLQKGTGLVSGVLFELDVEDFDKIKEWEFVGSWREFVEVEVKLANGHHITAFTEKAIEGSEITEVVDGLLYDEFVHTKREHVDPEAEQFYSQKQISLIKDWLKKQQ